MLELKNLSVSYKETNALSNFSARIPKGEITTILGPSGCGKSTLLSAVAGILEPDSGSIRHCGKCFFDKESAYSLPPEKRNIGFVFQNYALWPHLNISKNIGYPLKVRKIPRDIRNGMVKQMLSLVRLDGKLKRYPHELSGGEQQRAALGRALITHPDLLLMDEPLSNLDARLRDEMQEEIRNLQRELGLTILHVTHDQAEALAMSDHIIVMHKGRTVQQGKPRHVYRRPSSEFSADFIGKSNILEGRLSRNSEAFSFHWDGGFLEGSTRYLCNVSERKICCRNMKGPETVSLSLRPEDILIDSRDKNGIAAGTAVIERKIFKGASYLYLVHWKGKELRVLTESGRPLSTGTPVDLTFRRIVPMEKLD